MKGFWIFEWRAFKSKSLRTTDLNLFTWKFLENSDLNYFFFFFLFFPLAQSYGMTSEGFEYIAHVLWITFIVFLNSFWSLQA